MRDSLTRRPSEDMRLLMSIKVYERFEDDRQQNKGKAPITSQPRKGDFSQGPKGYEDSRTESSIKGSEVTFKESMHRIVD